MKILTTLCLFWITSLMCTAQSEFGNRNMVKKNVFIPDFHRIEAFGDFTIILREDSINTLSIVTDENHVEDIEIKSVDDKLVIKDLNKVKASSCQIYLHYNLLKNVELFGSVHVEEDLLCTFDTLTLQVRGESSVDLHLQAKKVIVEQYTNSKVTLKGQSNHGHYDINQNAKLNTLNYDCLNTYIELFDNVEAEILANYNLVGFLYGSSKLSFKGKSKDISLAKEDNCEVVKL